MTDTLQQRQCMATFPKRKLPILFALIIVLVLLSVLHLQTDQLSAQDLRVKCHNLLKEEGQGSDSINKASEKKITFPVKDSLKEYYDDTHSQSQVHTEKNFVDKIPNLGWNKSLGVHSPFRKIYVSDSEFVEVLEFTRKTPLRASKKFFHNMTTVSQILKIDIKENMAAMKKFQLNIGQYDLYREKDPYISDIIKEMRNNKIESSEQHERGTQFKLIFLFENGEKALFKPMRFPREVGTWENHYYFSDFERHYSEIASFHLDRILGFRRAVPVTGRYISISADVDDKTSESVQHTIFTSPAGNLCMVGECKYYCETGFAICGKPHKIQGSFAAYLPSFNDFPITRFYSPYRRSYSKRRKAKWEKNDNYCEQKVMTKSKYTSGRLFLDMIDMHIFDFFTGNMDRHHFEYFTHITPEPYLVHLDHGRGFGKPHHDELSILTPLIQCCMIRLSTLKTLVSFYDGPKLSERMHKAMLDDPVSPVLLEPHLEALDRRLKVILKHVQKCIDKRDSVDDVVIDDGY